MDDKRLEMRRPDLGRRRDHHVTVMLHVGGTEMQAAIVDGSHLDVKSMSTERLGELVKDLILRAHNSSHTGFTIIGRVDRGGTGKIGSTTPTPPPGVPPGFPTDLAAALHTLDDTAEQALGIATEHGLLPPTSVRNG